MAWDDLKGWIFPISFVIILSLEFTSDFFLGNKNPTNTNFYQSYQFLSYQYNLRNSSEHLPESESPGNQVRSTKPLILASGSSLEIHRTAY
jgi:hypothetical protein